MHLSPTTNQTIILGQLGKLLQSNSFASSAILRKFLTYVVTKTLQGEGEHLKEYVVAVDALGKSTDFNPQMDASVRIHAARLRKQINEYYATLGAADKVVISIPKGGYKPVFKNNNNQSDESAHWTMPSTPITKPKPTVNITTVNGTIENQPLEQICNQLSNDLTTGLAKFPEINVIARDKSWLQNNGTPSTANYVLSCYYAGLQNQWQITIELSDAVNHQILWNESFPIKNTDEWSATECLNIAKKAVGVIGGYMGIIYKNAIKTYQPNESDILYGLYWYHQFHQDFSDECHRTTLNAIEAGLKKFPDSAFLTAFKAQLYIGLRTAENANGAELLAQGSQWAYEAVGLDMADQHAWMVVAWANIHNRKRDEFELAIEKMVALNPLNLMYCGMAGFSHVCAGNYEKGYNTMAEVVEGNPYYSWILNVGFCLYHIHTGEYEKALFYANIINHKKFIWDPMLKVAILGLMGSSKSLEVAISNLYSLSPNFHQRATMVVDAFLWDKHLQNTILQGLKNAGIPIGE
jgi:TolB-like protein